jgi:hypothetical protein
MNKDIPTYILTKPARKENIMNLFPISQVTCNCNTEAEAEGEMSTLPENVDDTNFTQKVSFFNGTDICTSKAIHFEIGEYDYSILSRYVNNGDNGQNRPVMARIENSTSLLVYSQPDLTGEPVVYNNPYNDRYVVVKIPTNLNVLSISVRPYYHTIENFEIGKNSLTLSTLDLFVIIVIIFLIYYYLYGSK